MKELLTQRKGDSGGQPRHTRAQKSQQGHSEGQQAATLHYSRNERVTPELHSGSEGAELWL